MLAALALLWLSPAALAAGDEPPPAFPEAVRAPESVATRYVWARLADPGGRGGLDAISVDPADARVWLVSDHTGAVFRSTDAGATWVLALRGRRIVAEDDGPDDEQVLLDAQSTVIDEIGDTELSVDLTDLPEATTPDDVAPELVDAAAAAEAAAETARDQLAHDAARTSALYAAGDVPTRVWFDPAAPGVALVGRPDGIWRSVDGGQSWEVVDPELGATEFYRWEGVIVLGGTSGVRASVDGGVSFLDLEHATGGAAVYQLAQVGDRLYAATEDGLYRSADGLRWSWVPGAGADPVRTLVADPTWQGGLWIAGESGLRRSDDGATTFYAAGTQPMRGLRRLLPLDGAGHLLAIGGDGVWETMDGGVRWLLASRLLTEPDVRGVALVDGVPVVATADGVWRMTLPEAPVPEGAEEGPRGLSLGSAVAIASHRGGLDVSPLSLAGKAALTRFIPSLETVFAADWSASRDSDLFLFETTEDYGFGWAATVRLCWGGCAGAYGLSGSADYESYDPEVLAEMDVLDPDALDGSAPADGFYVVDGEVYADTQVVASAANVAEKVTRYRYSLANEVSETWIARQRLAAETPLLADRPVGEQVDHLLKLMELDARLDAWTDGAWSASLTEPSEPR